MVELFSPDRRLALLPMLSCLLVALLFMPAHAIRPSLLTGIITGLGVVAWFSLGLFTSISRFFGA